MVLIPLRDGEVVFLPPSIFAKEKAKQIIQGEGKANNTKGELRILFINDVKYFF